MLQGPHIVALLRHTCSELLNVWTVLRGRELSLCLLAQHCFKRWWVTKDSIVYSLVFFLYSVTTEVAFYRLPLLAFTLTSSYWMSLICCMLLFYTYPLAIFNPDCAATRHRDTSSKHIMEVGHDATLIAQQFVYSSLVMLYLEAAEDSVDVSNGLHDGAFTTIFLGCLLMPKPTVGKQLRLTETSPRCFLNCFH